MNATITPNTGSLNLTGQPTQLLVLGDLVLDPKGALYRYMLTYLAASAGLTPVYHDPKFMDGTDGIFPAKLVVGARVNLTQRVREVRAGHLLQLDAEASLCAMLANAAYESIPRVKRKRLKGNPMFEVLRHVRHAASHGNKWHFIRRYKEPTARGEWNGLVIDDGLKGSDNPLHDQPCIHGSLLPGDVLFLLRDIEKLL